jgi:hypothetical protein
MFSNKTNIKPKPKHEEIVLSQQNHVSNLKPKPKPYEILSSNKIDIKPLTQTL